MLLKLIKKNEINNYYILNMSPFWFNILKINEDYTQNIPPLLINETIINLLNENEREFNLDNTEGYFKTICFNLNRIAVHVAIKKINSTIDINLLAFSNEEEDIELEQTLMSYKIDKYKKWDTDNLNSIQLKKSYNEENKNFLRYNYEIDELIKKVFIEENSINSRVIKLENSLKEVEESLKEIEDNFFVTRIDTLKGFKRGDWRIIGTAIFIFIVVFYQISHLEKVEYIFEKFIPLNLKDLPTDTQQED